MAHISEAETIIKRILPYLKRLGYDIEKDLVFEEPVKKGDANRQGFIDILINCGKKNPLFLIEAKRDGTKITEKHRQQAIDYAKSVNVFFIVVTNGKMFEVINVENKKQIKINEKYSKIPRRVDINEVIKQFKKDSGCTEIHIKDDNKLPYRPGISLSKLNQLVQQCHNIIRKIEKNEEHAFSDFSKFLFLKLLEEKWDNEDIDMPYSYTFYELAKTRKEEADKVKDAINSMIRTIAMQKDYSEVLNNPIYLKQNITYLKIVQILAEVSFSDCDLDSKGAAFEYFVRATLKGKKLGQYFTPRPLVKLMLTLGKYSQIISSLQMGEEFKVLDPACGTGGFLVAGLNHCIKSITERYENEEISKELYDKLLLKLKKDVFYGIDANDGVASSAKMNMIIAGDGHSNIRCLDSLKVEKLIPDYEKIDGTKITDGKAHLILSNPPFGTSESESLGEVISNYDIKSSKGQNLFLQKMILGVKDNSKIVTVIDDGILNTESNALLREHILKSCTIEAIISLPEETFKPNKINVKSSVMVLKKRKDVDENLLEEYDIKYIKINSLGYNGSGEEVRGFDENRLIHEISDLKLSELNYDKYLQGYEFTAFKVNVKDIIENRTNRFDFKYWNVDIVNVIKSINKISMLTIKDINTIKTARGKSPNASQYVNKKDGFALVIKAGTNISKDGKLINEGDHIEEETYIEGKGRLVEVFDGDILISSTGDGTLGKCCVYRNIDDNNSQIPAVADGHVTVIRVDNKKIYPEYLCDYIRVGLGAKQIERVYTGSTGLIELTPTDVEEIILPIFPKLNEQIRLSNELRKKQEDINEKIRKLQEEFESNNSKFYNSFIINQ